MEPFPGYRLIQPIGRGGYAVVWEAEKTGSARKVALKFLSGMDSHAAPREIRAIQMVRQLEHANLVKIEQIWSVEKYIVIAMELAEGSLSDLLEGYQTELKKPIPPEEACVLLSQAAAGIDFLNSRHQFDGQLAGIQHCDIKPSNLLIFGDTVKVTDFGLSSLHTSSRIQAHLKMGTLDYAAPEIFLGQLSERTDQYSLAITYCYLRGGRLPYPAIDKFRGSWPMRRPQADLSMLSAKEQPVIARALQRVPQNRWPTCAEMMAQLSRAVSNVR